MTTLFNNELHPITSSIAFIQKDIKTVVNEFIKWQEPLINKHNNSFKTNVINNDLRNTLLDLCPLTTIERRRYLFIPTKSEWTAFFDNGHTGTDRTAPEVLGKKLNAKVIYISFNQLSEENVFEYYNLKDDNYDLIRSISVIKESKWEFHQYGDYLPFENIDKYKLKPIKERFTINLLNDYLKQFNINIFDENFYDTEKESILLNKIGQKFNDTKELDLNQAQTFFK